MASYFTSAELVRCFRAARKTMIKKFPSKYLAIHRISYPNVHTTTVVRCGRIICDGTCTSEGDIVIDSAGGRNKALKALTHECIHHIIYNMGLTIMKAEAENAYLDLVPRYKYQREIENA